jgi:hypothetical protein
MGYYEFAGVTPGTYSVMFVQPTGFNNVSPFMAVGSTAANDSDANPNNSLTSNPFTLTSGQSNTTIDAGFFQTGIKIIKTAGTAPDGTPLVVSSPGPVTFNYTVTTGSGTASLNGATISVRDDNGTPGNLGDDFSATAVLAGVFNIGDSNTNNRLDPGEMWKYQATVNVPFNTQIYAYAFQQIDNLRIISSTTREFQPNTSSGSAVTGSPGPGQLTNPFDTPESVAGSQISGINNGLGDNTGFFTGSALNSDLGQIFDDYARGDAWLAQGNTGSPVPITTATELSNLLFSTDTNSGVDGAAVSESYLNIPVTIPIPATSPTLYKNEGNGNGEFIMNSVRFTPTSNITAQFELDYRNYLAVSVGPQTPAGSPQGELASAEVSFTIQINQILNPGTPDQTVRPRFTFTPIQVNKGLSLIVPGSQNIAETSGQNLTSGSFTFQSGLTYEMIIRGGSRVDTRLVLQDQLSRTNAATVSGIAVGGGPVLQDTDDATVQLNTIPQPAPPLGSASVPSNGLPASNSSEPNSIGAMIPGTEALVPSASGLL